MITVTVTTKGGIFEGQPQAIVQQALHGCIYEATMFLERKVKLIVTNEAQGVGGAKGGLLSTIHGEVTGKGTPLIKGVVAHGKGAYGDVVEKGRPAGKMPPEGVLVRWIEVKLGVDSTTAQRLEFVIRRKIGRKGFPGVHMFERAVSENQTKLQAIFDRAGFDIAVQLS
jgi:hypothetical protein